MYLNILLEKFEKYIIGIVMGVLLTLIFISKCSNLSTITIKKPVKFVIKVPEVKVDTTLIDSLKNLKQVNNYLKELLKKDSLVIKEFYMKKTWIMNDTNLLFSLRYRGKMFPEEYFYTIKSKEFKIDTFITLKIKPIVNKKLLLFSFLVGIPVGIYIDNKFLKK